MAGLLSADADRPHQAQFRHPLSDRRTVELHDPGQHALPLHQFTRLSRKPRALLLSLPVGRQAANTSTRLKSVAVRARRLSQTLADPEILFFDEPSAGLDPISSRRLDDLIIELRESLSATIVVVTHELASIFAIGTDAIFLDSESKTIIAQGNPKDLLNQAAPPRVRQFLTRGGSAP